ncbi:hypothetical protein KM043_002749 [Ampulex compressa]|nr:hypothetical protein KM043_002749 [Ampulex compressa]
MKPSALQYALLITNLSTMDNGITLARLLEESDSSGEAQLEAPTVIVREPAAARERKTGPARGKGSAAEERSERTGGRPGERGKDRSVFARVLELTQLNTGFSRTHGQSALDHAAESILS